MSRRLSLLTAVAAAAALAVAPAWGAGSSGLKLHPSGFGQDAHASWAAGEGESDSSGGADQALYLQKMTATSTNSAAVAVIDGVSGMTAAQVGRLAFDWRTDGHCGAGAPRFNVTFQNGSTLFVGCQGMTDEGMHPDSHGRIWDTRSFDLSTFGSQQISSLAIIFDEGTDQGQGFVYLDNIQVGSKTWTAAADNGNS